MVTINFNNIIVKSSRSLEELIAKLQAATEGSRELDAEIRKAIPFTGEPLGKWRDGYGAIWTVYPDDNDGPPLYTTSIDAALTLFSGLTDAINALDQALTKASIDGLGVDAIPRLLCAIALKAREGGPRSPTGTGGRTCRNLTNT